MKIHHPDKGGDQKLFDSIQRAYKILSNEKKRSDYDRYGEESLKDETPEEQFVEQFGK